MSVDPITCHILDTSIGRPAANVTCSIYYISPLTKDPNDESAYEVVDSKPFAMAKTDNDGRIKTWVNDPNLDAKRKLSIGIEGNSWNKLTPGIYKIKFLTGKYFHNFKENNRTFFPFVEVVFEVTNPPDKHYHIPLLLTKHSYTTYRGS